MDRRENKDRLAGFQNPASLCLLLLFRSDLGDIMLLLPLPKLLDKGHYLLYQLFQLQGFGCQFVEESQRFLLPINGVNSLYTLVIVVPDGPELGVKLSQPDVKVEGVFVLCDDRKISAEYPRPNKIGGVSGLRSSEHG